MNAQELLLMLDNKLLDKDKVFLKEFLKDLNEKEINNLLYLNYKSPMIALILGAFFGFFGIDRFYQGDVKLGIIKLLLCYFTCGIWAFIDLYFVNKQIKKDNFEKIVKGYK